MYDTNVEKIVEALAQSGRTANSDVLFEVAYNGIIGPGRNFTPQSQTRTPRDEFRKRFFETSLVVFAGGSSDKLQPNAVGASNSKLLGVVFKNTDDKIYYFRTEVRSLSQGYVWEFEEIPATLAEALSVLTTEADQTSEEAEEPVKQLE